MTMPEVWLRHHPRAGRARSRGLHRASGTAARRPGPVRGGAGCCRAARKGTRGLHRRQLRPRRECSLQRTRRVTRTGDARARRGALAPVDRGLEGLLSLGSVAVSAREECERRRQTFAWIWAGVSTFTRVAAELESERQPLQRAADRGDVARVLVAQLELAVDGACPPTKIATESLRASDSMSRRRRELRVEERCRPMSEFSQNRRSLMAQKTIAFFPEAAFGPALNSVGIAPGRRGARPQGGVPVRSRLRRVYKGYGFEAHPVNLSEPMPPEQMAKFWEDFINGHIPNFRKSPYDQIDNYVKDCWDGDRRQRQMGAEGPAARARRRSSPTSSASTTSSCSRRSSVSASPGCGSSPARKTRSRIQDIPPHLSGCGENDHAGSPALPRPFQRGDQADPRRLQRVPHSQRRGRPIRSASSSRPRPTSTCCSIPRR